jgi:oligoendopeptidase F
MSRIGAVIALSPVLVFCLSRSASAQTRDRAEVAPQYQWRLEDLYPSDAEWDRAKNDLAGRLDGIGRFKGKLSDPKSLLACMQLDSDISKTFGRLFSYASMKSDQDTRESKYLALKQQAEQVATDYGSKASFIEPEIAVMDAPALEKLIAAEPGLRVYRMHLFDILRKKAHKLSDKEEKLLAEAGLIAGSPESIYSVLSNAEMPYPEITLSDGTKAKLDKAGYGFYRTVPNRRDREAVFQAFWTAIAKFKQTFGVDLYSHLQSHIFYSQARHYDSSLQAALDGDNIPVEVYRSLVSNVHDNLDTFHRYLRLKQRMLGVDGLKYSDVYAPVVKDVNLHYTFDQAKALYLDAVKPLGKDYQEVVVKALDDRWIDVYPTPGKTSGAYSNGSAYDVHPYVLLNYNGLYDDVSTLAHEMGHTMHSYYSSKNQPYPTAGYATFAAEVASTFNEALLMHKMLADIKDDDVRLSLLMNYLDNIKATVFRQTQFAEFELRMHEMAERREPVTGDTLTKLYGDIIKTYYGQDKGICQIDDLYAVEWAYVPHFYYNFYVYQYATSFTAATALAEDVFAGAPGAVQRYLDFISSGGSDYPIPILKKAGADLTTPVPFKKTMAAMNRTMDEIESILAKRK